MIDSNRSRNIEIMLTTMKKTNDEIKEALLSYDKDRVFNQSQLTQLAKYVPTQKETTSLLEYKGEEQALGKAEKYMTAICSIPRLSQRIHVMSVKTAFDADVANICKLVDTITEASVAIRNSKKLTKILEYILALGNYLNKGTNRGQASGFKLDGLIKFTETKGTDQSTTLLHYLCSTVSNKSPELLTFPEDLKCVKQAARVEFCAIDTLFRQLDNDLKQVEEEITFAPSEVGLQDFVETARKVTDETGAKITAMNTGVVEVAMYFGESGKGKPEAPYRIMDQFIESFLKARTEVEQANQMKADKARRAALGKGKSKLSQKFPPRKD